MTRLPERRRFGIVAVGHGLVEDDDIDVQATVDGVEPGAPAGPHEAHADVRVDLRRAPLRVGEFGARHSLEIPNVQHDGRPVAVAGESSVCLQGADENGDDDRRGGAHAGHVASLLVSGGGKQT